MTRRSRRFALFLAVLAMGLQGLWPLLAQAKPRNAIQVPVCTVEGVTHYIELPAGQTPLDERSSVQHEHCAFCFFGADRAALPSQFETVAPASAQSSVPPGAAEPFTARVRFLSPGNPRAPPITS